MASVSVRKVSPYQIASLLKESGNLLTKWRQFAGELGISEATKRRLEEEYRGQYCNMFEIILDEYAEEKMGEVQLSTIMKILVGLGNTASMERLKKEFGDDAVLVSGDGAKKANKEIRSNKEEDAEKKLDQGHSVVDAKTKITKMPDDIKLEDCSCSKIDELEEDCFGTGLRNKMQPIEVEVISVRVPITGPNVYDTTSPRRGYALIINLKKSRAGSEFDSKALTELLVQMKYANPTVHTAIEDKNELKKRIEKFKKLVNEEHKKGERIDSIVVYIGAHGLQGTIYTDDGLPVNIWKDIIYQFDHKKCPYLKGIPKLFFVQACQGDLYFENDSPSKTSITEQNDSPSMTSITELDDYDDDDDEDDDVKDPPCPYAPLQCDDDDGFENDSPSNKEGKSKIEDSIISFATLPMYVAKRNREWGSLYTYYLVKTIMENAHKLELKKLLRKIRHEMKFYKLVNGRVQISTWMPIGFGEKKFFFNPPPH